MFLAIQLKNRQRVKHYCSKTLQALFHHSCVKSSFASHNNDKLSLNKDLTSHYNDKLLSLLFSKDIIDYTLMKTVLQNVHICCVLAFTQL